MEIELAFITYNRLYYTRKALESILVDESVRFGLTIWDNGSTDGTVEYLKREVSDGRIRDVVFSEENVGQTAAVNAIWGRSKANLLGKLDNDCIVSPGWTRKLSQAHRDIGKLGVVACWHLGREDFDEQRAGAKIQQFGGHRVLRHPWTCGTGVLVKREVFERMGPIREQAMTRYWIDMARAGYVNGWYYPLVCQEHMDDPKSEHCVTRDEQEIERMREGTFSLKYHGIRNMEDRWRLRERVLSDILDAPWEVKYYIGWRGKMRRLKDNIRRRTG